MSKVHEGVIVKGVGGVYQVYVYSGDIFNCTARGLFRLKGITPTIGDKVVFEEDDLSERAGNISEILSRKNIFTRPSVANIDQLVITFAIKEPKLSLTMMDKLIVMSEINDVDVLICVNKMDIGEDVELDLVKDIYNSVGYNIVLVSNKLTKNIENLKLYLRGKISAFAGMSGSGKSSIVNTLLNYNRMETGDINRLKKGKHTTKHIELLSFEKNSFVIDSPGFDSLSLANVEALELRRYFKEFDTYSCNCRFLNCSHIKESFCGIKNELGKGVHLSRYKSYTVIYEELLREKRGTNV